MRAFLPVVLLFLVVLSVILIFPEYLAAWNVDAKVLLIGNSILFGITASSWFFHQKAMSSQGTQAYLRNVYGGMMVKMFLCILATFAYVMLTKKINKPALFTLMFLYLVYTFAELSLLMKYSKQKKNA